MSAPLAFLKFAAKAALNAVGGGVAGDFVVEVLPEIARDLWQRWGRGRPEGQLRDELQQVAQLPLEEGRRQAEQVAAEEAAGCPDAVRGALVSYLSQVPASIRQSQRRSSDPTGRTVASGLPLERPESLVPLLPAKLPRFKPGDRPAGIGDWQLEELLGVGGFGEVWKARNPHMASAAPVALKFCLDPAAARVLRHEADILDRVMRQGRHRGIVPLQHTYLSADPPCLEYEYVEGGELTALIRDYRTQGGLAPMKAAQVVKYLAGIIGFAHRLKPPIVHRDLKPANILMQRRAEGKVAFRVADFGIGALRPARQSGRRGTG
jgi:eukaryotic-like serine/threonine-protein kinase